MTRLGYEQTRKSFGRIDSGEAEGRHGCGVDFQRADEKRSPRVENRGPFRHEQHIAMPYEECCQMAWGSGDLLSERVARTKEHQAK